MQIKSDYVTKKKIPFERVNGSCEYCGGTHIVLINEKAYCVDCEEEVIECDDI